MSKPHSVAEGYADDDLHTYTYVPADGNLFVVIGDQGDEVYLSIEDAKGVFQDAIISYDAAKKLRDYLNETFK